MKRRFLKYVMTILILISCFQENVYADNLITSLNLLNYKVHYNYQNSLIPYFFTSYPSSVLVNACDVTKPEIFIIKNGQCVAYKDFDSDDFKKKDGSAYTSSTNFYQCDMDYSVCVFKYTFRQADLYVDQSTQIIKKYEDTSSQDTITYSLEHKVTKDINDTGINENYTCFYFDEGGKTLYIQFVTEFPDITLINEFNATFTYNFDTAEGHLTTSDDFVNEGGFGFLADESSLKYYANFSISDNFEDQIMDYCAFMDDLETSVEPDSSLYDRIWYTFEVIPVNTNVCIADNAKFILNGNVYQNPVPDGTQQLYAFAADEGLTSDYQLDNNPYRTGYYKNNILDGQLYIQFCVEKGDTPIVNPPSPNTNTTNSSSGHIVLNTGVTK